VTVRRPGQASPQPGPDLQLQSGDVLVLRGTPEQVALGEARLLQG
jgi:K+/H+ antiporter YhaU regulatory subunit KhtT